MGKERKYLISCVVDVKNRYDINGGVEWLLSNANYVMNVVCYGLSTADPCLPGDSLFLDIKSDIIDSGTDCFVVDSRVALFCDSIAREFGKKPVKVIAVFFGDKPKLEETDRLSAYGIIVGDKDGLFCDHEGFIRACQYSAHKSKDLVSKNGSFFSYKSIIKDGPSVEFPKQDIQRYSLESAHDWTRGYDRDD